MDLAKQIKKWVINDYFTPTLPAEIIWDTLLSPYIHELVPDGWFLTKEMSIPVGDTFGSSGDKIDYVLADRERVYLVELKTSLSSISMKQAKHYLKTCQGKPLGDVLGRQLLSILSNPKRTFSLKLPAHDEWNDGTLQLAFDQIIEKKNFQKDIEGKTCEEIARNLIKKRGWTQSRDFHSRKYLYTLGQLLDYLDKSEAERENPLWRMPMELIYLAPKGANIPAGRLIFLEDFVARTAAKHPDDSCAQLLLELVEQIYETEGVLWRN